MSCVHACLNICSLHEKQDMRIKWIYLGNKGKLGSLSVMSQLIDLRWTTITGCPYRNKLVRSSIFSQSGWESFITAKQGKIKPCFSQLCSTSLSICSFTCQVKETNSMDRRGLTSCLGLGAGGCWSPSLLCNWGLDERHRFFKKWMAALFFSHK